MACAVGRSSSLRVSFPTHFRCFENNIDATFFRDKDNREYLFDVVTEKSTWAKR